MKILVSVGDHQYTEATVKTMKVVYNSQDRTYTEYMGDDYLEPGDEVVERDVAY